MCFGGGNRAAKQAEAAEAERQARISRSVGDINAAFQGREAQYTGVADAVRQSLGKQLQKQQSDAARQLKFGLARGGLTGGSVAVDTGKTLGDEFNQATIGVENRAQTAASDLRAKDEASRLSMISLAQSGNDIGNAAAQTASMLNANIGAAKADNAVNTLGEAFGGSAQTYKKWQEAAATRRGLRDSEVYTAPFSRGGAALGGSP
jgi:hypothetical protein